MMSGSDSEGQGSVMLLKYSGYPSHNLSPGAMGPPESRPKIWSDSPKKTIFRIFWLFRNVLQKRHRKNTEKSGKISDFGPPTSTQNRPKIHPKTTSQKTCNPPHRCRCPGVSNQRLMHYIHALNTCFKYLRGRPAIPQTQNFGPHAGSQVDTIFITFRFWAYLVLFWQSLLRCCSSRSNFWRLGTLRDRFWKGSGLVLEGFLVGFLGQKSMQKAT